MIIFFSNLSKAIENYKYQTSLLRNNKNTNAKDQKIIAENEKIIFNSKALCRTYFLAETIYIVRTYLSSKFSGKTLLFFVFRVNIIWFIILYSTKESLRKSIEKLNARASFTGESPKDESNFKNFILPK
jgi:hypothetical protein